MLDHLHLMQNYHKRNFFLLCIAFKFQFFHVTFTSCNYFVVMFSWVTNLLLVLKG